MSFNETVSMNIHRYKNGEIRTLNDTVVSEEPLDIFINGEKKYFCMRMPGMDRELVVGLLYSEGAIESANEAEIIEAETGRISVNLNKEIHPGVKKIYSSSGSMASDRLISPHSMGEGSFRADEIIRLQNEFFRMQNIFEKTGGVHAVAFYDPSGELISFAEDIGRHNAVDKCTGSAIFSGKLKNISLIMLSSRISFEMIYKCSRAGAAVIAGVSAPTSAAVKSASESGITLIGFLRDRRFNIYSRPDRIII